MSTATPNVKRARERPIPPPDRKMLRDREFWATYLEDGEQPVWYGRPDTEFRLSGMGVAMAWMFGGLTVLATIVFAASTSGPSLLKILMVIAVIAALGALLVFGPAKLDQGNRKLRRYAVTDRRALAVRDIRHDRPRSTEIRQETKIICFEEQNQTRHLDHHTDDTRGYVILAFANKYRNGDTEVVQFERLQMPQVRDALSRLEKAGLTI